MPGCVGPHAGWLPRAVFLWQSRRFQELVETNGCPSQIDFDPGCKKSCNCCTALPRTASCSRSKALSSATNLRWKTRTLVSWDERSVVLITYGDQVRADDRSSLEAQRRFLLDHELDQVVSDVHLLPFFPYSSDDGFSVIDYRRVDPNVGDWPDVERLGESFGLMFDFVVNHCSQQNEWFRRYLKS